MSITHSLSPILAKIAAEQLNEKTEDNDFYINNLREWLKQQRKYKARLDDHFLLAFLRSAKFSLEIAKQKIENFYIYRDAMKIIFENRDIYEPNIKNIIKSG